MNEQKILFRLFNKLQDNNTITLNDEQRDYLKDLIRVRFTELKGGLKNDKKFKSF
jgi:hypothetical protein